MKLLNSTTLGIASGLVAGYYIGKKSERDRLNIAAEDSEKWESVVMWGAGAAAVTLLIYRLTK